MISKKKVVALATGTFALLLAGCVSFESDVFSSTSAAPTPEEKPAMLAQADPMPIDDMPAVEFRSISPR
ncbi:MAG: hypothetical protein DRP71_05205 [Verrucomicrobia bacterium]|nr:MAG: hypothetical protein DRP71_05205 [Verrucomicrobiota bacterium]